MTDEPIDLDAERKGHPQHHELHYCRKCGERWPCMQVRSLDEIERLRTELADEQRRCIAEGLARDAYKARIDAIKRWGRRYLAAGDELEETREFWAALIGEAS